MKCRLLLVTAAVAACLSGVANAETYRWVDQDGKPHYSDTPIQGAEPVTVKAPGVAPSVPAATDQKQQGEPTATDSSEQAAARTGQCEEANKRLTTYKNAGSIFEQDAQGNRGAEITGNDRITLIVKAQRDVKEFCGDEQAASSPQ